MRRFFCILYFFRFPPAFVL